MSKRGLSLSQTESFYDAFGAKQDGSSYYADATWENLIAHAHFNNASKVVEFGCGTGKFAEILFTHHLPTHATYWASDSSSTMIDLSKQRLSKFSERVEFHKTDGEVTLPLHNESVDRFVSNYVLDILSFAEIETVISEAKRVLKQDGLLCLSGLTYGKTLPSKLWTTFWQLRFAINPKWVGGCRPVALLNFLSEWDVTHHQVLTAHGISSEVVIARKK